MKLYESGEMYLETILEISKRTGSVRSVDIVTEMNLAKSTVSESVKHLKERGYIEVDKSGYITLTEQGKSIAEKIAERHGVLTEFLLSIGVSNEVAEKDACRIEHIISDETFECIKSTVKK